MGHDSTPNHLQSGAAPLPQQGSYGSAGGPSAPLPPSRRQQDAGVRTMVIVVSTVVMLVGMVFVLGVGPSRNSDPVPRTPSTHSQQDCDYEYLPCPTTTRGPLR